MISSIGTRMRSNLNSKNGSFSSILIFLVLAVNQIQPGTTVEIRFWFMLSFKNGHLATDMLD